MSSAPALARPVRLGLGANRGQFALLVLVNVFVGGMIGLERTVVPLVATEEFGVTSGVVAFSFIIAFGVVKAAANFAAGALADRHTRKAVLVAGWLVGVPVPFLLGYAPAWWMIVAANVLLGVNQGLAWSMAVTMNIDLVGPRKRGLAMGCNEAAGYLALGVTALLTGYIAATAGLRPEPFWLGIAYALCGTALSVLVVRDTTHEARLEASSTDAPPQAASLPWVALETSWRNRTLFGASQAGLVNNLNDGMTWAVLPLLFASAGVGLADIGLLKAVYPIVWGVGQLATGPLSDRVGRKPLIVWGMAVQAVGLVVIGLGLDRPFVMGMTGSLLLGVGTAMVYPALLAAVGDAAHPTWRATSIGVYRSWRDAGYAVGALMAGVVAGAFGLVWAVHVAAVLTLAGGAVAAWTMREPLSR